MQHVFGYPVSWPKVGHLHHLLMVNGSLFTNPMVHVFGCVVKSSSRQVDISGAVWVAHFSGFVKSGFRASGPQVGGWCGSGAERAAGGYPGLAMGSVGVLYARAHAGASEYCLHWRD